MERRFHKCRTRKEETRFYTGLTVTVMGTLTAEPGSVNYLEQLGVRGVD